MGILKTVANLYQQKYNAEPLLIRSPGRINLIGEHTDYNLGCVLPGTVNKNIYLAIGKRADNDINIDAADFEDQYKGSLDKLEPAWKLWPNYILGVMNEFKKAGKYLSGVNIVFGGDIPLSAGMSSSAALTCAAAYALNKLFNANLSKLEIAKLCVAAEHNYLNVKCGLMDQYANQFGKEGHLVKLNCKTEEHVYVPFQAENIQIVLFDSRIRHNFVKMSSAFEELRNYCQMGVNLVKQSVPSVEGLSDVSEPMLLQYVKPVDEEAYVRCLYVVQEMERLEKICTDLQSNDFKAVGQRMFENHYGLRDLYKISCDECDFLVDTTRQMAGVLGSRMMGAGFGGCTLNLIENDVADEVIKEVKIKYKEKFDKDLKVYVVQIGNGIEEVAVPVLNQAV